jgi:hypothetical protein
VPGLPHASPIVRGDRLYVSTAVKPGNAELKTGLCGDLAPIEEEEVHEWRLLTLDKASGGILSDTVGDEAVPPAKGHPNRFLRPASW